MAWFVVAVPEPVPEPDVVQYANAPIAEKAMARTMATATHVRLLRRFISFVPPSPFGGRCARPAGPLRGATGVGCCCSKSGSVLGGVRMLWPPVVSETARL
jgi:hypothetical protein